MAKFLNTATLMALLLLCGQVIGDRESRDREKEGWGFCWKTVAGAAAGATAVAFGAPLVLGYLGFSGAGIAAGSIGANMMSAAATTGYGAGTVSVLQSAGAAGLSVGTKVAGALAGAYLTSDSCDGPKANTDKKNCEK